jgi:hypothetical protein
MDDGETSGPVSEANSFTLWLLRCAPVRVQHGQGAK